MILLFLVIILSRGVTSCSPGPTAMYAQWNLTRNETVAKNMVTVLFNDTKLCQITDCNSALAEASMYEPRELEQRGLTCAPLVGFAAATEQHYVFNLAIYNSTWYAQLLTACKSEAEVSDVSLGAYAHAVYLAMQCTPVTTPDRTNDILIVLAVTTIGLAIACTIKSWSNWINICCRMRQN